MKQIKLTQGKMALVDDIDFEWLNQYKWNYSAQPESRPGYARNWKLGYMHRLINKTANGLETDHINQNKLDNRRQNLRSVNGSENQTNKPMSRNNTSGIPGVKWDRNRSLWKVSFRRNYRTYNVGNFKDKERAIKRLREALNNV